MTLTHDDLTAIGQVIDEKLEPVKKDIKVLKRDVKSIKKDLNWVIGKYDTRLVHLEHHTAHPPRQTL